MRQRLQTVNETKMKCIDLDLLDDIATRILFQMLDNYHKNGTTYINKELRLNIRHHTPRKYVVNLYNDTLKKDCVLIRALDDTEIMNGLTAQSNITKQRANITNTWRRDSDSNSSSDSSSDSEAPELVEA